MNEKNYLLSLSDILRILRERKGRIFFCTLLFSLLTGGYFISKAPLYESLATYRDQQGKNSEGAFKKLLIGAREESISQVMTNLHSNKVLEAVAKKFHLQGKVLNPEYSPGTLTRISENIGIEWAHFLKREALALPNPYSSLTLSQIEYEGNETIPLTIAFTSPSHFVVKSGYGTIGEGKLGRPFRTDHFSFTLFSEEEIETGTFKALLLPLDSVVNQLRHHLRLQIGGEDKTVLALFFSYPTARGSKEILDGIMAAHEDFLRECCESKAKTQISYLKNRQEEMFRELHIALQNHAHVMSDSGFLDFDKEMEFLFNKRIETLEKTYQTSSKVDRLEFFLGQTPFNSDQIPNLGEKSDLKPTIEAIEGLKLQRETLELALNESGAPRKPGTMTVFDLPTANQLYLDLTRSLQEKEGERKRAAFVLHQLENPAFELTSLSGSLPDPISQEIIRKSSAYSLELRDDKYHSEKEHERTKQELDNQKRFLQEHLAQTISLTQEHEGLLAEKTGELLAVMLTQVEKKISLQEAKLKADLENQLINLKNEKQHLIKTSKTLQESMGHLPEKWVSEQLLRQNITLHKSMAEELTKLVEQHIVSFHIETVDSAPLDQARTEPLPKSPRFLTFSLLGAAVGFLLSLSACTLLEVFRGVAASRENLELLSCKTAGHPSKISTWRRVFSLLPPGKILLFYRTPDVLSFATLLRKMEKRVLYIPIQFTKGNDQLFSVEEILISHDTLKGFSDDPYAYETLLSPRITSFLRSSSKVYDYIFLDLPLAPTSPEGIELAGLADVHIVTLQNEKIDELSFFLAKKESSIFLQM